MHEAGQVVDHFMSFNFDGDDKKHQPFMETATLDP